MAILNPLGGMNWRVLAGTGLVNNTYPSLHGHICHYLLHSILSLQYIIAGDGWDWIEKGKVDIFLTFVNPSHSKLYKSDYCFSQKAQKIYH